MTKVLETLDKLSKTPKPKKKLVSTLKLSSITALDVTKKRDPFLRGC